MIVKGNDEAFPWVNAICWQLSTYLSLICTNELLITNIFCHCCIVVKRLVEFWFGSKNTLVTWWLIQYQDAILTVRKCPWVETRRSYDRLISSMWFPILTSRHLFMLIQAIRVWKKTVCGTPRHAPLLLLIRSYEIKHCLRSYVYFHWKIISSVV